MKVLIEVNEPYLELLKRWASVSRTMKQATDLLSQAVCAEGATLDVEEFNACISELEALEPALNSLHQTTRSELWRREVRYLRLDTTIERLNTLAVRWSRDDSVDSHFRQVAVRVTQSLMEALNG